MIDLTHCPRDPLRTFNGANGNKISINYEGHDYVVKFPAKRRRGTGPPYTNNCFSEHVSCQVLKTIGMNVQDTILATFTDSRGEERTVVACRDFTEGGKRFFDFGSLKNTCIETSENGYGTELSEIEAAIGEQTVMDPTTVKEFFWEMFICDTLLGNFDRHNGNWGFLVNGQDVELAPIYDCASCLFPQLPVEQYRRVLDTPSELSARVHSFPSSSIMIDNTKINYYEFITSLSNTDCNSALNRLYTKIDMNKIEDVISNCEELSDIQKEFYTTIIGVRKERIIDVAMERLTGLKG